MLVTSSTVASIEYPRIRRHIRLMVSFVVLINRTSDRGPGILEHKNTFYIVSFQFLSIYISLPIDYK